MCSGYNLIDVRLCNLLCNVIWLLLDQMLSLIFIVQTSKINNNQQLYIDVRENRKGNQQWIIQRHWQHWTHTTQDKDKQSKKRLAPRTPSTNRGWTQMLSKGQQFPLLIRHTPCCSYLQSTPAHLQYLQDFDIFMAGATCVAGTIYSCVKCHGRWGPFSFQCLTGVDCKYEKHGVCLIRSGNCWPFESIWVHPRFVDGVRGKCQNPVDIVNEVTGTERDYIQYKQTLSHHWDRHCVEIN
jgi:hypothetical protein